MNSVPNSNLVTSYFYQASNNANGELVCYVAGFKTKIKVYFRAINTLRNLGFDVLAFDYDPSVLDAGDPQILLDIVAIVTSHVSKKSKKYTQTLCMGVSLGSFISYNVQKRVANAYVGAYAVAGVDTANVIFGTRTFKEIAKAFRSNGYNGKKLNQAWKELDAEPPSATFPANKSFIAFDGTLDRVVKFSEATHNIKMWADKGIRVKQYVVKGRGHLLTVAYFIRHTKRIISLAKQHHLATN